MGVSVASAAGGAAIVGGLSASATGSAAVSLVPRQPLSLMLRGLFRSLAPSPPSLASLARRTIAVVLSDDVADTLGRRSQVRQCGQMALLSRVGAGALPQSAVALGQGLQVCGCESESESESEGVFV